MKYVAILVLFLYSKSILADCPNAIINQGTPAPCTGWLISQKAAEEAEKLGRKAGLLEHDLEIDKSLLTSKDNQITALQTGFDERTKQLDKLKSDYQDDLRSRNLYYGLFFGAGVISATLLAIGLAFAFGGAAKVASTVTTK